MDAGKIRNLAMKCQIKVVSKVLRHILTVISKVKETKNVLTCVLKESSVETKL